MNNMNLQEHIRRILKEEVNKKYLKPSERSEKLILDRLNNLISDSKMFHIQHYKTRHDFEFCKNGKEVMSVALFFEETNNRVPTSERRFEKGILSIPKEYVMDILTYIPVRKNYLFYLIEEWFDNNFLKDISNEMGRNDLYIDELSLHPNTADVCVPPMTKPDGVTMDEMIDYVMKNTLFKRNDLLKHEDREPGFIEDLYLKKLRNAETERLRDN